MTRIDPIIAFDRPATTPHRAGLLRYLLARIVDLDRRYREAQRFADLTAEQRRDMGVPPRDDADGFYTTRGRGPAERPRRRLTAPAPAHGPAPQTCRNHRHGRPIVSPAFIQVS